MSKYDAQGRLVTAQEAATHDHDASEVTDFDTEVSNNADVAANTAARHAQQHAINATADHTGVPSATLDNLVAFDANGLPKDSGLATGDVVTDSGLTTVLADYPTETELGTALADYVKRDGSNDYTTMVLADSVELTIAAGVITAAQTYNRVDTESDAASDDLVTINGGIDGKVIKLVAENDARTVVLKHGTGNIVTPDGNDFSLDTDDKIVELVYSGAISAWRLSGGGGTGGGASDLDDLTDVAISGAAQGDILTRDGTGFINKAIGTNEVVARLGSGDTDGVAMAASTILARLASGDIVAATVAQINTLLGTSGISAAILEDRKTAGTNGGTFTAGAWRLRDLNTEVRDPDSIVTIATNQFTITNAGEYLILAWSPALAVNRHKCRIYDVTAGAALNEGGSGYTGAAASYATTSSFVAELVTIAASNTYQLEAWAITTKTNDGFGLQHGSADHETYSIVIVIKIG